MRENVTLSPKQREHLEALADIRDTGTTGEAFWTPSGAEHRTADSLARRGLLRRHYFGGLQYELTLAGYAAVRDESRLHGGS